MTSAPILPNYLGLPFRILVSPVRQLRPREPGDRHHDVQQPQPGSPDRGRRSPCEVLEDGQYNIQNMSIEETYGFGILNEGQAIAVAKNVKIRPNEFVMPARSVFNLSEANNTFTDLSSAAIFDASHPIAVNN